MKFAAAMLTHVLMGLVLVWGILQAVHGNYWLLIAATLAYLVAFARIGCSSH